MSKWKDSSKLFQRKCQFQNNELLHLPNEVFKSDKWSNPELQNLKTELNDTKSLLNAFEQEEWSKHSKNYDPSSYIPRIVRGRLKAELCTQAWCKFYECLANYDIISRKIIESGELNSLHLCEAPGAFITALNHYLVSRGLSLQWQWYATSLNPDYEGNSSSQMIPDDRLLRHTYQNWYFGKDFTGDITKYINHEDLIEKMPKNLQLITADGSFDCSVDPGNQESSVAFLHYCETLTALRLLQKNGNLILKIFTTFEDTTINLLYLLNCVFHSVAIFKPASSKSGNSEVYLICLNYNGFDSVEKIWFQLIEPYKIGYFEKSMFNVTDLSEMFLKQIYKFSHLYTQNQSEKIRDNVSKFKNSSDLDDLHNYKIHIAKLFITKFKIKKILNSQKLITNYDLNQFVSISNKLSFSNGVCRIATKNLIHKHLNSMDLLIKIGKKIEQIQSSRFCYNSNFFPKSFSANKNCLYENIVNKIAATTLVIDLNNFDCYYKLQKTIFERILANPQKQHILFIKFPLITHFCVSLFFLLLHAFNQIYLHKTGFLILSDCNLDNYKIVFNLLKIIEEEYERIDDDCDICHFVSPNLFYNNGFFDFIWNYNSVILS